MIWQISIHEGMKAAEQRMKELQKLIENGENYLQYKFPVHSKHHRLACFAKNGRKKAVNLFQDLLLHVLSLGGGVADNVFLSTEELKKLGTLVYLKIDPETAYKRIEAGGIPPFLAGSDPHGKFLQICQKRMPRCEELADVIAEVPADGDADALSAVILTELEKRRVFEK